MKNFNGFRKFFFTSLLSISPKLSLKIFALVAICFSATSAYGDDRCIKDGIRFSYNCAKLEYEHHSRRLKIALDTLMQLGRTNKKDLLEKQDKWVKYRQKACDQNINADNTFVYWQHCLAKMTESRANEVEKMAKKR